MFLYYKILQFVFEWIPFFLYRFEQKFMLQLYITFCPLYRLSLPDRFKFLINYQVPHKPSLHLDEFVRIKTGLQVWISKQV